jgi:hypothetical protein
MLIVHFLFTAVLAFLLATLAVTSFAVPVQHSTWRHSCGQAVRAESKTHKTGGRHSFGNILKAVKKQLQVANEYFKSEDKNIKTVYYQVKFSVQVNWSGTRK